MKLYALDLNKEQWTELLEKLGEPKFRATQLLDWLWQKHVYDVEEMTNLSKTLREKLSEELDFAAPVLIREQRSKDGTRKFLWQLRDGNSVESVLLKSGARLTACISTQVGCPLGCTFCATGLSGFVRNLSSGEIAGQFLAMEAKIGREINNVVYMGMGEPMLNKDEVFKSVRMLNDEKLRGLGIRHITISTCGIVAGIEAMAEEKLGARLAVSLHAVDDELRSRLMPVNERYPLAELKEAIKRYQEATGDRVSIEYALFGGVNDSVEHARALVRFLKGIHVFINLIPFNAVDGRYDAPQARDILKFRKVLETAGFENELRQEQGADIDAACGQLRRKDMEGAAVAFEPVAHTVTKKDGRRLAVRDSGAAGKSKYKIRNIKDEIQRAKSKTAKTKQITKSEQRLTKDSSSHLALSTSRKANNVGSGAQGLRGSEDQLRIKNEELRMKKQQEAITDGKRQKKEAVKRRKTATETAGKFYENIKGKRPRRNSEEDAFFDRSERKVPRKKTLPEKERYRSGKLKEERPVYRGQIAHNSYEGEFTENAKKGRGRTATASDKKSAVKSKERSSTAARTKRQNKEGGRNK